MKSLRDYIAETETWATTPVAGDEIDFEIAPDELVSMVVVEATDDALVLSGDATLLERIQRYGAVGNSPGMGHTMEESAEEELDEEIEDVPTEPAESAKDKNFSRMMELAGVADHKFDKEDDVYSEDQSAGVVAQKEIADRITEPMPGVHEEEIEEDYDVIISEEDDLDEAEYRGRKVPLGKPMRGDVKKFKVYVKDPKTGNVKKVNFGHGGTSAKRAGQKTMKIKKSNPARRKSFRARHNCDNPGPRTKARYWSCRAW